LTPTGAPFFGGTYYPPVSRGGLPGFPEILKAVADGYKNRQSEIEDSGQHVLDHVSASLSADSEGIVGIDLLHRAFRNLEDNFDDDCGGFGNPIKFPQPLILEWLLRYSEINVSSQALPMLEKNLINMANGGIYDHIGGGFHRYSTDREWLVPHFEKMLYDNALVPRVYLQAYLKTKKENYLNVALDTVEFVMTQLTSEDGLFYSSMDADSEGQEGIYYTWTTEEIVGILGREEGNRIGTLTGMTQGGNFEGKNILHNVDGTEEFPFLGCVTNQSGYEYPEFRLQLLSHRNERPCPERDEKVIVSWNALMSVTLIECYLVTRIELYRDRAIQNIKTILKLKREFGFLFRSYRGGKCSGRGFLEDYSALTNACIKAHQATLDLEWIQIACDLAEEMIELFWDPKENRFYDSSGRDDLLLIRPRDIYDGVMPSPVSSALETLHALSVLTDNDVYKDMVICELVNIIEIASQNPLSFGKWLSLMDTLVTDTLEIAIVSNNKKEALEFVNVVFEGYLSNFVLIGNSEYRESDNRFNGWDLSPLLNGRSLPEKSVSGFLCKDYTCELPVHSVDEFRKVIESAKKDLVSQGYTPNNLNG